MSHSLETQDLRLSRKLLARVVRRLVCWYITDGTFNHYQVRDAGNACRLLGYKKGEKRLGSLLSKLTPEMYWGGAITNLDVDREALPPSATELWPMSRIEKQYPPFPEDYGALMLRYMGGSLALCADRNYEPAMRGAVSEFGKEQVILAKVLMEDYSSALDSIDVLSQENRRVRIIQVILIELYRKGRRAESKSYKKLLPSGYLRGYGELYLALAAANRIPWSFYPFPDW